MEQSVCHRTVVHVHVVEIRVGMYNLQGGLITIDTCRDVQFTRHSSPSCKFCDSCRKSVESIGRGPKSVIPFM